MPQSRFTFLYGGLSDSDAVKTAQAQSLISVLEDEFGGGIWDPEKVAVLHVGDIVVFPSKEDIQTGASGKWVKYPSLGPDVKGYKDLLQVNGSLKLVSHKSLNKSYRLIGDPDKQLITQEDTLRRVFEKAGTSIGAQLRCLAWMQETGLVDGWRLKSADSRRVLKFRSKTDEESQRDYIFEPIKNGAVVTLTAAWVDQWNAVKATYALDDSAGTPAGSTDDKPF